MTAIPRIARAPVVPPELFGMLAAVWATLHELAGEMEHLPWTVVGGQMVYLHALEHDVDPPRVSTDIDVAVDVRSDPKGVAKVVEMAELTSPKDRQRLALAESASPTTTLPGTPLGTRTTLGRRSEFSPPRGRAAKGSAGLRLTEDDSRSDSRRQLGPRLENELAKVLSQGKDLVNLAPQLGSNRGQRVEDGNDGGGSDVTGRLWTRGDGVRVARGQRHVSQQVGPERLWGAPVRPKRRAPRQGGPPGRPIGTASRRASKHIMAGSAS